MAKDTYTAENIQVLKGLEGVRKRPSMYIGDTSDGSGLHHLVYEVLDNAIDEALAGHCDKIEMTLHQDGSVAVTDNGRGIPVDIHPQEGISAAEVIMTRLHAGGKFDTSNYKVSGGLHGVGVSVVNALSKWLKLKIFRQGRVYYCEFALGDTVRPLQEVDRAPKTKHGTEVVFLPDDQIFPKQNLDFERLCARLDELAYLNPTLTIIARDLRKTPFRENTYHHQGGLVELVEKHADDPLMRKPIFIRDTREGVEFEAVVTWTTSYGDSVRCFTNNVPQPDGGTHLTGLRSGLSRAVQRFIKENVKRNAVEVTSDDIREGLHAALSVKMHDPKYSSQTKEKLVSSEVRGVIEAALYEHVSAWLNEHKTDGKSITEKVMRSASVREAARKARDLARRRSEVDSHTVMPHKLADCQSKDGGRRELLICEGDSAGGSAKQARNREFQAVLPLKGKILNVEKSSIEKLLANEEVCSLIAVLGTGIGESFDIKKLRYHRIILVTDADVDGSHIRTLLLTLFYRQMPELLRRGHVYIAQPPLYRARSKNKDVYLANDAQLKEFVKKHGQGDVQRFKGLGEMNPEQLWTTTLDPKVRRLIQVSVDHVEEAEEYFSMLMGDSVEPRKEFIYSNALNVQHLDV